VNKKIANLLNNTNVAYLATATSNRQPYVTPVVFILQNGNIYVPLDEKPKTVSISQLKRVKNIQENPNVCFLIHHYEEDWSKLWFVMLTGYATLVNATSEISRSKQNTMHTKFLSKYSQYKKIGTGNLYIRIKINKITYWKYT
jgi:PPOX class probable F420-dependent enzyme